MTQKRFLLIFANLVATKGDEAPLDTTDVYWKIQAVIYVILQTCKAFETYSLNSIDEQMMINTGISAEYKELGLGGSVVKCWVKTLPQNENLKNSDNSFTGIPLLGELKTKGIYQLGVLKTNRMEGAV